LFGRLLDLFDDCQKTPSDTDKTASTPEDVTTTVDESLDKPSDFTKTVANPNVGDKPINDISNSTDAEKSTSTREAQPNIPEVLDPLPGPISHDTNTTLALQPERKRIPCPPNCYHIRAVRLQRTIKDIRAREADMRAIQEVWRTPGARVDLVTEEEFDEYERDIAKLEEIVEAGEKEQAEVLMAFEKEAREMGLEFKGSIAAWLRVVDTTCLSRNAGGEAGALV